MSKFLKLTTAIVLLGAPAFADPFGLGREALPEEIAAWDIDVRPDGRGLPKGQGDVYTGEEIFAQQCAACHGDFAEGRDNWPELAGGFGTLDREDPVKTVGSYWPHLSTVWDYVNRSMPFGAAQTLEPDDVYAMVAYILYSNDLVDDDFVLSDENLASFEMPNAGGFIVDDRMEVEFPLWVGEPCMENCKDSVEITMRAMVLDVTPQEEAEAVVEVATAAPAAVEAVAPAPVAAPAADPELIAAGEKVYRQCKSCHQIGDGAQNRTGPLLTGIVGHPKGSIEGFRYSRPMQAAGEEGLVWDEESLRAFLTDPKGYMQGTRMSFRGLRKEEDLDAIIAYLSSFPG